MPEPSVRQQEFPFERRSTTPGAPRARTFSRTTANGGLPSANFGTALPRDTLRRSRAQRISLRSTPVARARIPGSRGRCTGRTARSHGECAPFATSVAPTVAGSRNACIEGNRPSWDGRLRQQHSTGTRGNFGTSPSNRFGGCVAEPRSFGERCRTSAMRGYRLPATVCATFETERLPAEP
jgi:hypothetical protein